MHIRIVSSRIEGCDKKMKYKVIKEYDRFYLCESKQGHEECFFKNEHKQDDMEGFEM